MKKLVVAVFALALVAALPKVASAQQAQSSGMDGGTVLATLAGAVVGGAVGYYYFTGRVATVVGIVLGGAIGSWWYSVDSATSPARGKMKMQYSETPGSLFQPIGFAAAAHPVLSTAASTAAAQ
jgi:uncharacterized protein YcfJ